MSQDVDLQTPSLSKGPRGGETSAPLDEQVRHWRHPIKNGLITITGDEDGDIPELTAEFLFGGAQIDPSDVLDSN